jgi:hypothetical protein
MPRGYPLGALFVIVAASAVLVAGVAPLARTIFHDGADPARILLTALAAAAWGMIVGLLVGLISHRSALASGLGALSGTFIGAAAGMVSLLPVRELAPAAAAMTAGSALIIGIALVMRHRDA